MLISDKPLCPMQWEDFQIGVPTIFWWEVAVMDTEKGAWNFRGYRCNKWSIYFWGESLEKLKKISTLTSVLLSLLILPPFMYAYLYEVRDMKGKGRHRWVGTGRTWAGQDSSSGPSDVQTPVYTLNH
jgi:hypothetical protein